MVSTSSLFQCGLFLAVVAVLRKPLGGYMTRVFNRERTFLDPLLCPVERLIYHLTGVSPDLEMDWKGYSTSFILFGLVGTLRALRNFAPSTAPTLVLCRVSNYAFDT